MSTQHRVETPDSIVVAALYKFVRLHGFEQLQQPLLDLMHANDVRGTLLLADEGINGTISGPRVLGSIPYSIGSRVMSGWRHWNTRNPSTTNIRSCVPR